MKPEQALALTVFYAVLAATFAFVTLGTRVKMTTKGELDWQTKSVTTKIRYLKSTALPSIIQNRRCYTQRSVDGSDSTLVGCDSDLVPVEVRDARALLGTSQQPSLGKEGFELRDDFILDPKMDIDFFDHDSVVRHYYPQVVDFIKRSTGAKAVFPFDHNVRSTASAAVKGSTIQVQPPLGQNYGVHTDYTVTSGARRMLLLTQPPKLNDALRKYVEEEGKHSVIPSEFVAPIPSGSTNAPESKQQDGVDGVKEKDNRDTQFEPRRMVMFNVWRSISRSSPVKQMPLAMCAADSVAWDSDLVVFEVHYADRIGENFMSRHNPDHRWYYFPEMTSDECLFFKQWDSWGAVNVAAVAHLRDHVLPSEQARAVREPAAASRCSLEHLSAEERDGILADVAHVLEASERFEWRAGGRSAAGQLGAAPGGERGEGGFGEGALGGRDSATLCLHTAIEDPRTPADGEVPPRESIEVRCFAFY